MAHLPPHSFEAETTVLGAVLVHPRKWLDVAAIVTAEDFYHPAHRAVFEAMVELDAASKPIDAVSVTEQMREMATVEKLNSAGGPAAFMAHLMASVVTVESVGYHAGIVRSKADRRRMLEAVLELRDLAMDDETPDDDFTAQAEAKLLDVQRVGRDEDKPQRLEKVLTRTMKLIERRYEQRDTPGALGITTGIERLDALTTGLQPGEMWVLAARPSMGKSAFAGWIVQAATAMQDPYPSLMFSLEMPDEMLAERMIASESGINLQKLRTGRIDAPEWRALFGGSGALAQRRVWIHPKRTMNIAEIRSSARRWRLDEGASARPCIVVVDYLQLVASMNRGGEARDRQLEVAAISRGLKLLALEIGGAVLALAQLNRKCEERADKRPVMSDLRESGAIEQDADTIAFLYRDEVYHPDTDDKGIVEIIIGKQRNGPLGAVRCGWDAATGRFHNL